MTLAEIDWSGIGGLLVLVIGALSTALATLIPIYFKSRRGAEAMSAAIDESERTGESPKAVLKRTTSVDADLGKHLDTVRDKATRRLDKGGAK